MISQKPECQFPSLSWDIHLSSHPAQDSSWSENPLPIRKQHRNLNTLLRERGEGEGINSLKASMNALPRFDRLMSLESSQGANSQILQTKFSVVADPLPEYCCHATKFFVLQVAFSKLYSVHIPSVITVYQQTKTWKLTRYPFTRLLLQFSSTSKITF